MSTSSKPLIGITGRQYRYGEVRGCPELLADAVVDAVLADYVTAVLASGGLPVHIPMDVDPVEMVDGLDGVLLTGGADIDPGHYRATVDPNSGRPEPKRDDFELAVAEAVIAAGAPTLGVCRGIQVLNIAAGGTLRQHVPAHARYDSPPKELVHDLLVEPGSALHAMYGPRHRVNSFHHQVVDELGLGFTVTGRSDDGEIEAIESPDKPIIGVQWHPEMLQQQEPLFDWLVGVAAQHRSATTR